MRICMLLRNPFTRDARVLREARGLAAAGHEVTVLALRARGLPASETLDGFTVARAVSAGALAGPTISHAAGASRPARRRPRPGPLVWWRDRLLTGRFARAAAAIEADVFHAHDLNTLQAALHAARTRNAGLVYDAHELYPELTGLSARERARWGRLERILIGEADAVIAPSDARADELRSRYGIARPFVVMNCPPASPPPDPSASSLAALRRPNEPIVVYAGGFTPNRGLENVVRAARLLPEARLVMIGWGPLEHELHLLADNAPNVEFPGPVPPDDVVGMLAGADVGLAPYLPIGLNNRLAAPNKLFEYLHAGLAVAGSDLPDIRAVVTRHEVGTLFDAADPASIAMAVRDVIATPQNLATMRARARKAASLYTWETQLRVLLEVYESLSRPR